MACSLKEAASPARPTCFLEAVTVVPVCVAGEEALYSKRKQDTSAAAASLTVQIYIANILVQFFSFSCYFNINSQWVRAAASSDGCKRGEEVQDWRRGGGGVDWR